MHRRALTVTAGLAFLAILIAGCNEDEPAASSTPTRSAASAPATDGQAPLAPVPAFPQPGESEFPMVLSTRPADTASTPAGDMVAENLIGTASPGPHPITASAPGANTHSVYPSGGRAQVRTGGDATYYNANGTVDVYDSGGNRTHLDGDGPSGSAGTDSFTTFDSNGRPVNGAAGEDGDPFKTFDSNGNPVDGGTPADPGGDGFKTYDGNGNPVNGGAPADPGGPSFDTYDGDGNRTHVGPDGSYAQPPGGPPKPLPDAGGSDAPPAAPEPAPVGKAPSVATGEPHYLSEDGTGITAQSLGEFVLSSGEPGQQVQARTEPYKTSTIASAITALAFGVGDHKVVVHLDGSVVIDSKPFTGGQRVQYGLSGGGAVGMWRGAGEGSARDVAVVWPDLSVAIVHRNRGYLNLDLQWRRETGRRTGVLGSDNGDPADDRTARDGSLSAPADVEGFVRSWRVSQQESLFDYADGQSTATFTRDDFPAAGASTVAPAPACDGLPAGFARDSCVYDVGLTGDNEFATSSLRVALRLLIARLHRVPGPRAPAGASPSATTRPTTGISLTAAERDGATREPAETTAQLATNSDTAVFAITVESPSRLTALSRDLSCINAAYAAGRAGYAFFAADLSPVGGPRQACDDDPDKTVVPAGTYYLKLVGPGKVDVAVQVLPQ